MDKLALMAVGVFMVTGIHLSVNSHSNLAESESRLAEDSWEILARNAALVGLDRARQMLSEDFHAYENVTGANDGVSYRVDAATNGIIAVVRSTGTAHTADGKTVAFNVQAKYRQRLTVPTEAPAFMRYAVISDEDLVLRGNIEGDIYVDGNEDNTLNANMHTNKNLDVRGRAASVKGFGTFVLTASPSAARLNDIFVPNHNPAGADNCYHTNFVEIPPMVPVALADELPVDSVTDGDLVLSGVMDLGGTPEDPFIWHIVGNLTIQNGGTVIHGYTMFLVNGSADLKANVQVGGPLFDRPDESTVAFYTGGGVRMRGNSEIWGQIFSAGGIEFDAGTPAIYGSVTTKGAVDFRGTVDIFYRKASPVLTTPFQPDLFMLDRIAYSEW